MPHNQAVIDYYTKSEVDYRWVWHLKSQLAIHYGYWDTSTRRLRDALRRENQVLAELARISAVDHVLDAGCGIGGSAIYLAESIGCSVTGITITPPQVEQAKAHAGRRNVTDKVRFEVGDYLDTPFEAESFDVVWSLESFCHAADKAAFMKEAYRLLKPGGRLVIADWFTIREPAGRHRAQLETWREGWGGVTFPRAATFVTHLQAAGFSDIEMTEETIHIMPSAKRLHRMSYPARVVDKVLRGMRVRGEIGRKNVAAARAQYLVMRDGVVGYYFVLAEKK